MNHWSRRAAPESTWGCTRLRDAGGRSRQVPGEPAGIEQASPRGRADLYVALTRTTRRLGLVITGDVPRGLAADGLDCATY
jgi:hypothetical protein